MILTWTDNALNETVSSAEATYDHISGNWDGRNHATLAVFPSILALIQEYKNLLDETVVLFSVIPPEFVARKSSFWRLVVNMLQTSSHYHSHATQIKAALHAAPGG